MPIPKEKAQSGSDRLGLAKSTEPETTKALSARGKEATPSLEGSAESGLAPIASEAEGLVVTVASEGQSTPEVDPPMEAAASNVLPEEPITEGSELEGVAVKFEDSSLIDSGITASGYLDGVGEDGWAAGWAEKRGGEGPAELAIWIDGLFQGIIIADQFRGDLRRAGKGDKAFWFNIPDEFRDGEEHVIEIKLVHNGKRVKQSPAKFKLGSFFDSNKKHENIIGNSDFISWPNGVSVNPKRRFSETAAGWRFEYKKGTEPKVRISIEKPEDAALRGQAYGMNIAIEADSEGYMRLITPIDLDANRIEEYRFSVAIRRPIQAAEAALHISEIFVATLEGENLTRIFTVKKVMRPKGTQRLVGIPLAPKSAGILNVPPNGNIVLAFDLKGAGELAIFSPELSVAVPRRAEALDGTVGLFEDRFIQGQVGALKLSDIWHSSLSIVSQGTPLLPPKLQGHSSNWEGQTGIPFIQIVVPVYNATIDVEECLRSIIENTFSPFEIIIFDDGSGDYAAARLPIWERIDPRIRYFRHPKNVGYTSNINYALQSTVSEYVVLINSDTIVTSGWLNRLYEQIIQDDRIAGVGPLSNAASWQSIPRTKGVKGEWIVNDCGAAGTPEKMARTLGFVSEADSAEFPLLNGFCTLFRKRALEDVGYYDDLSFPQGYGEENDLCLRLGKRGWKLKVAMKAYVFHKKSKSFGISKRAQLSKAANEILKGKHPEVNFAQLEERMRTNREVSQIREILQKVDKIEIVRPIRR